jgi:hypothetical protein
MCCSDTRIASENQSDACPVHHRHAARIIRSVLAGETARPSGHVIAPGYLRPPACELINSRKLRRGPPESDISPLIFSPDGLDLHRLLASHSMLLSVRANGK